MILELTKESKSDGVLQSQISEKLKISKSTVSELISKLESEKMVVRKLVSGKAFRVWHVEYAPFPIKGLIRVGILKASEYPKVVSAVEKLKGILKIYDSGIELTRDLVSGVVDVAASPIVTQLYFGILMKNIKIHRIVAKNGSGVVFSNAQSDCYGCSEVSTMELNLRRYISKKMEKAQIRYFKSPEAMIQAIEELRGIAIWEPYFTKLSDRKTERFEDVLGDFVCCSLASNKSFGEENPELLEKFIAEFDKAKYGREEAKKLAQLIGFEEEIIYKSFENYDFEVEQEVPRDLEVLTLGRLEEIFSFQ